jgi:hypothetical protein
VMNSVQLRVAASGLRSWPHFAVAMGTRLPVGVPVPLTDAGAAFTAARPTPHDTADAAAQQVTCEMYQHKARIAAVNGGDTSGSHPAWDPV